VLGQPQWTATNAVRSDGRISFPEHGEIMCAGFTPEGLRAKLENDFQATLKLTEPKVYVAVSQFDSKSVTVVGEVIRPGRFPYRGRMTVVDLYGLAVGTTTRSWRNKALLFREIDGGTRMYQVHLKDFFEKGDFATNFYIQPGDVLYVPKNNFAEVGDGIRTALDPIAALFDTVSFGNSLVTNFVAVP
jgi:polysaccharide export outer membrane protein